MVFGRCDHDTLAEDWLATGVTGPGGNGGPGGYITALIISQERRQDLRDLLMQVSSVTAVEKIMGTALNAKVRSKLTSDTKLISLSLRAVSLNEFAAALERLM